MLSFSNIMQRPTAPAEAQSDGAFGEGGKTEGSMHRSTGTPHPSLETRRRFIQQAERLKFSVDCVPVSSHLNSSGSTSSSHTQPSILLLTQNIGGIDASVTSAAAGGGGASGAATLGGTVGGVGAGAALDGAPSINASTPPCRSFAFATMDHPELTTVPEECQLQVLELLADVRSWLHRLCFLAGAQKRRPQGQQAATTATRSQSGSNAAYFGDFRASASSSPAEDRGLPLYSASSRPPLIDIFVIHFQEIGGKCKNNAFTEYFRHQIATALLPEAGWTSGLFLDERESVGPVQSAKDNGYFTAIGSIVFLSPRMLQITGILSIPHRTYIPVADDPLTYSSEAAAALFHSGKFAEAGRSRKGFLLFSLRLGTVVVNFCNVHLFHDDDNRVAFAAQRNLYTDRRARALREAMAECSAVVGLDEPLFLFGDLNVRMDGKAFLEWVAEDRLLHVRPAKKELRSPDGFWKIFDDAALLVDTLRPRFDVELHQLMDMVAEESGVELAEMPVQFAPTYSREACRVVEEVKPSSTSTADGEGKASRPHHYCRDRLPAWCDRILLNASGLELMAGERVKPPPRVAENGNGTAPAAAAAAAVVIKERQPTADRVYVYQSVQFLHTDHDGVYLLF